MDIEHPLDGTGAGREALPPHRWADHGHRKQRGRSPRRHVTDVRWRWSPTVLLARVALFALVAGAAAWSVHWLWDVVFNR